MRRRIGPIFLLLLGFTLVSSACTAAPSKPTVVILSPPHGSQFTEGEEISFLSTVNDDRAVTRVELVVNGSVVRSDSPPNPQGQPSFSVVQKWKSTPGNHTVSVRAFNASGLMSDPVGVSISVVPAVNPTKVATPPSLPPPTNPPPPPAGTALPSPPAVASPTACVYNASFVADVTVPPGTALATNQTFNKIWRIRNDGNCSWDQSIQFVFIGGEAMTTSAAALVPYTAAGSTADILIAMTAPATSGTHAGQWQLRGPQGLFGAAFSVSIDVIELQPLPPGCPGAPIIASFSADPVTINAGQSSTLNWGKVDIATSAVIDQGIGGVATPGSQQVTPAQTTTYTLTATGCGGTTTKQVTITVNASGAQPAQPVQPAQPLQPLLPVIPILPVIPAGDVVVEDVFLSTQNEVVARVAVNPSGSLTGSYTWRVFANNVQVAQNTFALPSGSQAFWSGYKMTGTLMIRVVVEISDNNTTNNQMTKTCYAASHTCQ